MHVQPRPNPHRAVHILLLAAVLFFAGQLALGVLLDSAPLSVRFPQAVAVLERADRKSVV